MLSSIRDGWTCVGIISDKNRLHINSESVENVKMSDIDINSQRNNNHRYNIKIEAHNFLDPTNAWLDYPHTLYFTNKYIFSSTKKAVDIMYSNVVSLDINTDPITIHQQANSLGFACGDCGDTFFAYGAVDANRNGLFQSFSGFGSGSVWIR